MIHNFITATCLPFWGEYFFGIGYCSCVRLSLHFKLVLMLIIIVDAVSFRLHSFYGLSFEWPCQQFTVHLFLRAFHFQIFHRKLPLFAHVHEHNQLTSIDDINNVERMKKKHWIFASIFTFILL